MLGTFLRPNKTHLGKGTRSKKKVDGGHICWDKKSNRWSDFLVFTLSWASACLGSICCRCCMFVSAFPPKPCSEFVRKERMTTWLSQHDWGRICWDKKSNRWSDFLVCYCTWVELVRAMAVLVADVACSVWHFHRGVQNVSERRGWQHDLASMTEGAYAEIKIQQMVWFPCVLLELS